MKDKLKDLLKQQAENELKLEQVGSDLEAVQANKDKLKAEMEEIEDKLAEAKKPKPKLRHGDYGIDEDGTRITVGITSHTRTGASCWNRLSANEDNGTACGYLSKDCTRVLPRPNIVWLGNIFDDLKAMQETVTEFEMDLVTAGESIECHIASCGGAAVFNIRDIEDGQCEGGETVRINLAELPAFIRNLQCMQATLKRQEAKK